MPLLYTDKLLNTETYTKKISDHLKDMQFICVLAPFIVDNLDACFSRWIICSFQILAHLIYRFMSDNFVTVLVYEEDAK